MAEFVWEARARSGELRKGTMEAEDENAVTTRLRQQNLNPVKVKRKLKFGNISLGSPVSTKDLVTFTRLFATMIDAGLPLVQCLDILANQQSNKNFGAILKDIKNAVEQGSSFSDALRRHPKVFDELFVNLVQAGEVGGILDTIMNRLSVYLEKRQKLIQQVRGAMVYPIIVIIIASGVMTVLLTFVIPAFENMFADFGGGKESLPQLTRIVIAISEGFVSNLPFIIPAVISRDRIQLRIPKSDWEAILPQDAAQASVARPHLPEDRRGSVHANAGNAAPVGCADSRCARHLRAHSGQRDHRGGGAACPRPHQ
jgi:type IV pilus assembly protein PilC